jgi:hypothetical protein
MYMPSLRLILIHLITLVTGEKCNVWSCLLHNKEHYDLYFSPNIIRVIKIEKGEVGGNVARMREIYACRVLMGKLECKRPPGRHGH